MCVCWVCGKEQRFYVNRRSGRCFHTNASEILELDDSATSEFPTFWSETPLPNTGLHLLRCACVLQPAHGGGILSERGGADTTRVATHISKPGKRASEQTFARKLRFGGGTHSARLFNGAGCRICCLPGIPHRKDSRPKGTQAMHCTASFTRKHS